MFPQLPEEMERKIWQSFWSMYVLKEVKRREPIWLKPSNELLYNCSDLGAFQHGHSDLEKTLFHRKTNWEYMRTIVNETCFQNICYNCLYDGFPCMNATYYGLFHPTMTNWWDMSHYNNVTNNFMILPELDIDAEFI